LIAQPRGVDLALSIQSSTNLQEEGEGSWLTLASQIGSGMWNGQSVGIQPAEDGLERITFTTPSPSSGKVFYRLKVRIEP